MSSSSSSSDPVAALGDAWRRAREALRFSSVRGREAIGSHVLRIGGYSVVGATLPRGECVESEPFRAGGHRWKLSYYPNGYTDSTSGCASAVLWHLDNRFLGRAAEATAGFRVVILDGDGNAAFTCDAGAALPAKYSVRGRRATWIDVKDAKADALRRLSSKDGGDNLSVRCDVTVQKLEESRVKYLLRGWFAAVDK
ncbi:unnamed protein product [Urochloa humidicola]